MRSTTGPEYHENELMGLLEHEAAMRGREDRLLRLEDCGNSIGRVFGVEFTDVLAGCGPFESVALGYLALTSAVVIIFAANLAHPLRLLCVHALVAVVIVALCRAEANIWTNGSVWATATRGAGRGGSQTLEQRFWHFWRHWYPHLFFLFCFE